MFIKGTKDNNGITLVALVITIIILLILAGVAISQLTGKGLIYKAQLVKEENFKAEARENIQVAILELIVEKNGEKLSQNDLINEDNGLHSKNNSICLNEDNAWVGMYSNEIMQIGFIIDENSYEITLDAEVKKVENSEYYIIYEANGGENPPDNQKKSNNIISNLKPTRQNYIFIGWGTSASSTNVTYKPGDIYNGKDNIILYALWLEKIETLETNGIQYIDTEVYPNQDTSIEFIAETAEDTAEKSIAWFGSRIGSGTTNDASYAFWNINNNFRTDYNKTNYTITDFKVEQNKKYTIYKNKNVTNINSTKYLETAYENFESTATLTLFGIKNYMKNMYSLENSVDYRAAKIKLYSCKIWDNDELVRDYIPVKSFENEPCLYDLKNNKFYYLENTIETIENIESTGKQYIDTEFYPNQDTRIEFVAETTDGNISESVSAWFGSRDASGTKNDLSYVFWNINNNFRTDYNKLNYHITDFSIEQNKKYTINQNKNITYIDNIKYKEFPYENFQSTASLTLFGLKTYNKTIYNSANSVDYRMAKLKLYSCKIWDNDKLIRDYIPIIDFNNVKCLFDIENRKIYYSSKSFV